VAGGVIVQARTRFALWMTFVWLVLNLLREGLTGNMPTGLNEWLLFAFIALIGCGFVYGLAATGWEFWEYNRKYNEHLEVMRAQRDPRDGIRPQRPESGSK
jgi:hypothetical protein